MSIELIRNWGVDIFVYLIYMYVFISDWIYKKDIEIDRLGAVTLVSLICVLPFMIISEAVISKNNKVDEEVEQIISILPIIKEELILGRLINSGFILYTLIIPYITMYIFTPKCYSNDRNKRWIIIAYNIFSSMGYHKNYLKIP